MTHEQSEKLRNYLDDTKKLKGRTAFPFASILLTEKDRDEVIATLGEEQIMVLECHGYHPDIILWHLVQTLETGQAVALNVRDELDPKLMNQLMKLTRGQIDVELPWAHEPLRQSNFPKEAKVILLLEKKAFDESARWQDIVTTACRI